MFYRAGVNHDTTGSQEAAHHQGSSGDIRTIAGRAAFREPTSRVASARDSLQLLLNATGIHLMLVSHLGQSGFRLQLGPATIYIDPYLSDSVEKHHGTELARLRPAPFAPTAIADADLVLVSHAHLDHCDPETLGPIAAQCPRCRFLASYEAAAILTGEMSIAADRVDIAGDFSIELEGGVSVRAVPAAHPELDTDAQGRPRYLGFIIEYAGQRAYHAGDGRVHAEVISALGRHFPIDTAFLPVNECNYSRAKRGIVGNMSIRDAITLAEELGVRRLVPMHYDMFALNSAYEEEISLIFERLKPPFRLEMPRAEMFWLA